MPIYKTNIKKDGKFQYKVRVNYTDINGEQRQLTRIEYGAAEAKALEARLKREFKDTKTIAGNISLGSLCDEYLAAKLHDLRASSYDKLRRELSLYVLPYLQNVKLSRLSAPTLQKWKNTLNETALSVTTKRNAWRNLSAVLNHAVRMEYIPKNPLHSIINFKDVHFESAETKIHYYTAEQFSAFISAAKDYAHSKDTLSAWGYYIFFMLAYFTGMRKGEINALKWADIENNVIHVRRSVAQKLKGVPITETPPKNKRSIRDIQMPIPLKIALNEHYTRQQPLKGFTDDFRVCGGANCLSDSSIDNHNRKFADTAALPHIRVHDFRHSHASLLANEGINIQEIARRLGHSDVQTTWQTYAHLYPKEEERALSILNRIKNV